jgi:hypothetical protein
MTTTTTTGDKVIEILRATNDGSNLSPDDLYLIECAVNGYLSTVGEDAFKELYDNVCILGSYNKMNNYIFGIEHITEDHEGYIYFKGQQIDHFSHNNAESKRNAAQEAQNICLLLEKKGHPINSVTYCWRVENYLTADEILSTKIA